MAINQFISRHRYVRYTVFLTMWIICYMAVFIGLVSSHVTGCCGHMIITLHVIGHVTEYRHHVIHVMQFECTPNAPFIHSFAKLETQHPRCDYIQVRTCS